MALYIKRNKQTITKEVYNSWSKALQEFFDNALPWILMTVDVRFINEKTVKLISVRFKLCNRLWFDDLDKWAVENNYAGLEDFLMKECIGFSANVHFADNTEFMKKLKSELPRCTKRVVKELEKEFFKEENIEACV